MEASALQVPVARTRMSIPAPWLRLRSDEQLVALFRSGSEDAFRAIHDRYRARLLVYTRQMLGGSRADAEDVLQDVFVRAYGALRTSDRPVSLRAWLYRIAHNRCIDHLRRPVAVTGELLELFPTQDHDPPLVTERREQLRRLVVDVGRLPDQQRSALLMRELQGMSYIELARALDVSVAAVKSLLVRARTGLVDAAEARDTACGSVRSELALACDRGVRCSGVARRHLRDCSGCRDYRDELRGMRRTFSALAPIGPIGMLWQCLVAGGTGGGGGAAAVGSGGGAAGAGLGTAGTLVTSAKVALVCAAAAVTATGTFTVAGQDIAKVIAPGGTPSHATRHHSAAGLTVAAPGGPVPVGATGGTVAPLAIPDTDPASPAPAPAASSRHHATARPLIIEAVRDTTAPLVPVSSTPVNSVLSPANTVPLVGASGTSAVTVTIGKGTPTTVSMASSSTTSSASDSTTSSGSSGSSPATSPSGPTTTSSASASGNGPSTTGGAPSAAGSGATDGTPAPATSAGSGSTPSSDGTTSGDAGSAGTTSAGGSSAGAGTSGPTGGVAAPS